jgi:hypothetical protein
MFGRIKARVETASRKLDRVRRRLEKIRDVSLGTDRNWAGMSVPEQRAFFAAMSASEQRAFFGDNGFLWVPDAMSASQLAAVRQDIETHHLTGTTEDIWVGASFAPLIDNPKVLAALQTVLGPEVRFFKAAYAAQKPIQTPGMKPSRNTLHVDYGIGETISDWRNSCASWINVGFYLSDLTAERSPFWVVPGSNRYYHVTPWTDMEYLGDDARMVLAQAGDALLFHCLTIHATAANVSETIRDALFYSYRPAWARHIGSVPEWPQAFLNSMPEARRKLLVGLNEGSSAPRNTL